MSALPDPDSPAKKDCLVLEGAFLVERALDAGLEITELYCVPAREAWATERLVAVAQGGSDAPIPTVLSESQMAEKAGYAFHRGVFALARRPNELSAGEALALSGYSPTLLVLPELADPENLGSAFRNAAALGCGALLLGPTGPDPLCRRVLRVSMGASFSLPWARLGGPSDMRAITKLGYVAAACVLDPEAVDIRSWERPEKLALVLGNEAFGLGAHWLAECDRRVTLPMRGGADSLNLATAAAVFLYALARQ